MIYGITSRDRLSAQDELVTRLALGVLSAVALMPAVASAEPVTFDWAYVGNAGNAPDPITGLGAVPYNYAISKTEVTNAQYAAFLNSVDPEGTNELRLHTQVYSLIPGNDGIERSDSVSSDSVGRLPYNVVPGFENRPVINVSLESATRFANWLHNGQRSSPTETGSYTVDPSGPNLRPGSANRNPGARFWIPNDDEWYKAAFHDAGAGLEGRYFEYANGSNTPPASDHPDDDRTAANYYSNDGIENGFNEGSAILQRPFIDYVEEGSAPYPLADVGSYYDAASPYGTFDQNGNVAEWTETRIFHAALTTPLVPLFSSSSFVIPLETAQNAITYTEFLSTLDFGFYSQARNMGFRVATIPEPSGCLLLTVAFTIAAAGRLSRTR